MAIKLIANYAKRLGLPGYSSHQFSVSVEVELRESDDVAGESERLYKLLQQSVDEQMQETGFVPPDTYGMEPGQQRNDRNSNHGSYERSNSRNPNNGYTRPQHHGNYQRNSNGNNEPWNCTDGQRGMILRLINDSKLDKNEVEQNAQQMFGVGVKQLDKMQASQLIEDLLEKTGKKPQRSRWNNRQPANAR